MDQQVVLANFRSKHKSNLDLACKVALEPQVPFDRIKDLGFRVPRSVAPSGAIRFTLPSTSGFLVTTGVTHEFSVTAPQFSSGGPYARTLVLMLPSGIVVSGSEALYRPWHNGTNVSFGAIIWPIESTYDLPVLQSVGSSVLLNFGASTTALSLPGFATTCALSGVNPAQDSITSLSSTTVPPQGAWKTALGPCMNYPESRRPESYYFSGRATVGDFPMDSTPGAPVIHIPSFWTNGNSPLIPATGIVGGSQTVFDVDRSSAPTVNPQLLPFLIPTGTPGRIEVSFSWGYYMQSAPAGAGWIDEFSAGATMTFTIPTVGAAGNQQVTSVFMARTGTQSLFTRTGNAFVKMSRTETWSCPIPPFAVSASLSVLWGNNMGLGNLLNLYIQDASFEVSIIHETAVLRPAVATGGLSSNAITTLTCASVLVTESTPANALLLGSCPVIPASEELMVDIEGLMGSIFQRQLMLTVSTSDHKGPELQPHEVTKPMEQSVKPTDSGTFLFPLAASLLSRAAPTLFKIGKAALGAGVNKLSESMMDADEDYHPVRKVMQPQVIVQQPTAATEFTVRTKGGGLKKLSAAEAQKILQDSYISDTAVKIAPASQVQSLLSRKQKKKLRAGSSTGLIKMDLGPLSVNEVVTINLLGNGDLPGDGRIHVMSMDEHDLQISTLAMPGAVWRFNSFFPVPNGEYELTYMSHAILTSLPTASSTSLLVGDSAGVLTTGRLMDKLMTGGAAWGVGIYHPSPSSSINLGSFWLIEVEPEETHLRLVTNDGGLLIRDVEYEHLGNLHVDRRLLESFGDLAIPFMEAYSGVEQPMFVNSICSLDGEELHNAHGGSLLASTLCAMCGIPRPDVVFSGTPWCEDEAAIPDKLQVKVEMLHKANQLPLGALPCLPPTRLFAMVTDGHNQFPSLDQLRTLFIQSRSEKRT